TRLLRRLRGGLLVPDVELGASVPLAPLGRPVVCDRPIRPEACRGQATPFDPVPDEVIHAALRAIGGELLVEIVRAAGVGVALDVEVLDVRVHLEQAHDFVEDREAPWQDLGAARLELDLLQDLNLARPGDAADELRAAVLRRLRAWLAGLLRTSVLRVGNAVL